MMVSPFDRERLPRPRIRLAALCRHSAARDPVTGNSSLAVAAGQASGRGRERDRAWGLESALNGIPLVRQNHQSRRTYACRRNRGDDMT